MQGFRPAAPGRQHQAAQVELDYKSECMAGQTVESLGSRVVEDTNGTGVLRCAGRTWAPLLSNLGPSLCSCCRTRSALGPTVARAAAACCSSRESCLELSAPVLSRLRLTLRECAGLCTCCGAATTAGATSSCARAPPGAPPTPSSEAPAAGALQRPCAAATAAAGPRRAWIRARRRQRAPVCRGLPRDCRRARAAARCSTPARVAGGRHLASAACPCERLLAGC